MIQLPKEKIAEFCRKNHIKKLSLFGSVLKGIDDENSDIDILVEFEKGFVPGFIGFSRMESELSGIIDGQKVDLRTPEELSRYFRDEVISLSRVEYAK